MTKMLEVRMPKEDQPLQATKWLKIPMLLEVKEMEDLLETIGQVHLYPASGVHTSVDVELTRKEYVEGYKTYLEGVKKGENVQSLLPKLAAYLTEDMESLYLMKGGEERYVVKPHLPMMTLQPHYLSYSPIDQKFRSQVFGKESIMWGVILSFPQLYQEPATGNVLQGFDLPNGQGFKRAQKWVRTHTKPTPFMVEGEKIVASVRCGNECFSWINEHPQLKKLELSVQ